MSLTKRALDPWMLKKGASQKSEAGKQANYGPGVVPTCQFLFAVPIFLRQLKGPALPGLVAGPSASQASKLRETALRRKLGRILESQLY